VQGGFRVDNLFNRLYALRSECARRKPYEKREIFLVYLIEDGDHGLLDDLVLQRRDPQRTLPPIASRLHLLDGLARMCRDAPGCAGHKAFLQTGLILLPRYAIDSGAAFR